ncbi:hypothetical protein [Aquimarina algiphila]|uniref:hypothetical protein n=1 Tax=Aquimarina algiphila TaxID=2047982 RepID=UPI0024929BF4|nr:hypothetical protein [Aquimarina algiphila]
MKKILIIVFLLFYGKSFAQYKFDFSNLSISESKVDSINYYYNKVLKSKREEKKKFEKQFFQSLPNNHTEMSHAMYIDSSKKLIEYEENKHKKNYIPKSYIINPWVKHLSSMDYNDKKEYYRKYFNICIGGKYGADYMQDGFEIYKRFLVDTEQASIEMNKLNDEQIESIFWFIFDETHPEHNEKKISLYNQMMGKIKKYNSRIAYLLEKSYNRVLSAKKGH